MEVSVWDTYVPRQDGKVMHFDILVPSTLTDIAVIYGFGKQYLASKPFVTAELSVNECKFCHMQEAPLQVEHDIMADGYYIIEMENCS
ncbi:DUF2024 domain-containing protein [Flagellimonas aquimarina]|uniref:DUF2024 domain-containing protein n=1 Tax=Flagellimonas aquimarina TaxID=2201895 RepID=A0A316KW73_9FLAO|nr:DUF2024 family protein [Allomuricauda koreensis]PWL37866.1 DUF2024 domain-containing protein [Allomuricauda koreensis]